MKHSRRRRRVIKLSSYIIHFGDAINGAECNQGCSTAVFNRLASAMNGISNKMYGVPWLDADWDDADSERWSIRFHNNYSLFDRTTGTIGRLVIRIGSWLNHKSDPGTDYIWDGGKEVSDV